MSARPDRSRVKGAALLVLVALLAALVLSACGGSSSSSSSSETTTEAESEAEPEGTGGAEAEGEEEESGTETAAAGASEWCGEEGVTLGIQDGGGLNNWSKESQEQVQMVSKECPAVATVFKKGRATS